MSHPTDQSRYHNVLTFLGHPAIVAAFGSFWLLMVALNQPFTGDEARWTYVAREWLRFGVPLYSKVVENKPPPIFCLMAFSDWLGPQFQFHRLLGMLSMVATSFVLYLIARRWRDHWSGLLAMTVFLYSSASGSFEGDHPAVTETFMNLFSALAFYGIALAPQKEVDRPKRLLTAGLLMGFAIAFKQIAVTTSLGLYLLILDRQNLEKNQTKVLETGLWLFAGFLLATTISLIPVWIQGGSIRDYLNGAWFLLFNPGDFGQYPGTTARWTVRLHNFPRSLHRLDTILFLLCVLFLLHKRRKFESLKIPVLGLLAWMICDTLGVHASGYYFAHQFKQLLPSLSLALGLSLRECISELPFKSSHSKEPWFVGATWLLITLIVTSPKMPPISRCWQRLIHPVPSPEETVGRWLNEHTSSGEFIFTIGRVAHVVLYYSGRRSSSRYFNSFFIDAAATAEVSEDLTIRHPPHYIVLQNNLAPDWLQTIINHAYAYRFDRSGFWIYEKLHS